MLNTLLIVVISIPGSLITGTMAAYAFGRFNFYGKNVWFVVMLGTMMIPTWVTLIPQYLLFHRLKLINTYVPLTIGSWLGGGAFTIFLLRQFIMSIPRDLDEAAHIDGASPLRILVQVIVPLMKPALTTLGILSFLGIWNNFFGPFIYLNKKILFTVAVGLRFFQTMPMESNEPKDHLLMAAASVTTIPVLLVFIFAQRYFVQGVVMSGLKL
jgi:multiple sugar transport system permease protein